MEEIMKHEFDDQEYANETHRKSRLLNLFEKLEGEEKSLRKQLGPVERRYTRIVDDSGTVSRIRNNIIDWTLPGGEKIQIQLPEKIVSELRLGDEIFMCIGKRQKIWRIIFLKGIASTLTGDKQTMSFKLPKDSDSLDQIH